MYCVSIRVQVQILFYGERSEYPIEVIINIRMIGYWARLITGKATKLSNVIYQCLVYLDSAGMFTSPWIKHIRCILNNCGMSGIWINQQIDNPL